MMPKIQSLFQKFFIPSLFLLASTPAKAEITPDNTLGAEASTITPNGANADLINGGAQRGSNLFHSFIEFNINDGQSVYFGNPSGVQNILTRVTGGNGSNILGTLGVNGNANLFLINPNGILFGQNARLDIRGSFVGTTANAVQFGNQGIFSATNPQAATLLTVNPSALLFNQINQNAAIQNNSIAPAGVDAMGFDAFGLRVADGKSLLLVGGNVSIDGGQLNALGGKVELGGLAAPGTVGLNVDGNIFSLSFPDSVPRADVSLASGAKVEVTSRGDGNIAVNARNIILRGSRLVAGIKSGIRRNNGRAGDITLNATGEIKLELFSSVKNQVDGIGNGGNINIFAGLLFVNSGSGLYTYSDGQGDAGSLIINARERVSFDGYDADINVEQRGIGKGGDVRITTGELLVTNGAVLSASTIGQGDAGNIIINARDRVSFDGSSGEDVVSGAYSIVGSTPFGVVKGNGGDIRITTGELSVTNGARLSASTFEKGNAGNIIINAPNRVIFDGTSRFYSFPSEASSITASQDIGNGGDIRITTSSLSVTNGAVLDTRTFGDGNAGNIIINASDRVSFDGMSSEKLFVRSIFPSSASSSVGLRGQGKGGDIRISTESLSITNGAQLIASTSGPGNAGNVIVDARDAVSFDSISAAFTSVQRSSTGKGGEIRINSKLVSVTNGAQLINNTDGQGDAGNIQIKASDTVDVSGTDPISGFPSALYTFTNDSSTGKGGDITVNTNIFRISEGALLDARTRNNQKGGDIQVNANVFEALNGGQLTTTTASNGNAGKITVNANNKVIISGIDFNYSYRVNNFPNSIGNIGANSGLFVSASGSGITGDIEVNSPKITLDNQGKLNADSTSGNGGNINVNSDLLLLRRGAQISTNAGTAEQGGDGGNINIKSTFIVAVPNENSDITANAFSGAGGNINIFTQNIFGIEARLKPSKQTNDITASSELGVQGQIEITQPEIQPTQGLIELPNEVIDASTKFSQICPTDPNPKPLGKFIVTGRGSLPPSPLGLMTGTSINIPLATLDEQTATHTNGAIAPVKNNASSEIIEAQGMIKTADGIVLVANAPQATPSSRPPAAVCPVSQ
ncbi:MAG: filamentous hemagglutinin N-terminal domain-containing protein [Aulosira sp. DedQUE10]|nr:filamentous hemagglutinin N-terminal domain-containing protein [Aulosira sp. DedQUE10]